MSSYPFASAKLRSLEAKILDQTDIERMVDAPDFATAFKVLNDTDYADNLLDIEPVNYRDALRADYQQLYTLLKKIIPDRRLFTALYLNRDFLNIKLLLKIKFFNLTDTQKLLTETVYDPVLLHDFIMSGIDRGLDPAIKRIITDAIELINKRPEPRYIDLLLTHAYFAMLQKTAKKLRNQFMSGLIELQIDNANVLVWLRAKRLKLERSEAQELLIEGGSIAPAMLMRAYEDSASAIRPLVARRYSPAVVDSFDQSLNNNSLFGLEKALENFEINYYRQTKMVAYGPEVIIAYFAAKRTAVRNVRIIMTGKFNKVPAEEIKKTIRQTF